jgi:type IV pilus assembly protein PilB
MHPAQDVRMGNLVEIDSSEALRQWLSGRCGRSRAGLRLGEILLGEGVIDAAALARALTVQGADRSRRLGRVLIDQAAIQPWQLDAALAAQAGIARVRLDTIDPAEEALRALSPDFATRHRVLPLLCHGGALVVAMPNPFDTDVLDQLRFHSGREIIPALASPGDIALAHSRCYSRAAEVEAAQDAAEASGHDPAVEAMARPIVLLFDSIVREAVLLRASDINIRPEPSRIAVHCRIDGRMRELRALPRGLLSALVSRVKVVGRMDIAERRLAQEGGARFRCEDRVVDLRISVIPTVDGESVVIRILDRSAALRPLSELGLPAEEEERIRRIVRSPHGLFLVCGPTGAGKSTSLYAVLNELRGRGLHLLTAEDPVEYRMDGIEQVQIAERIGYTFPEVLRRFLRHDPDVIMIGEIRDGETAAIACRAALTGHLVLSSLHTNDAASAVMRLIDLGVERHVVAAVLRGVMAQRLLRLRCDRCPPDGSARCPACGGSGYRGRRLVCEVLECDTRLARLIEAGAGGAVIAAHAFGSGMKQLTDHARELLRQGLTTLDEFVAVAGGRAPELAENPVCGRNGGEPASPDDQRAAGRGEAGDAAMMRRAAATPLRSAPSSVAG